MGSKGGIWDNLWTYTQIVKAYYNVAGYGIFSCNNCVGDDMTTVYEDEDLTIDVCYGWAYFEVFGLSDAEFLELEKYYNSLRK